ncbi:hypothetical protein [Phocoenobacter atlanticus]|uniref:hypothetical protein n=1 Tax=Phocoenobacter atlanticus TaxID=3416742 RepID=UPI002776DDBA|nr:hypothetical protein [Pasteurella atlantica]MDP8101076.1 hypothetical protein [Pasteurella atlantica]
MPIKFIQLFQDSWNFIQNQRQFSLFSMGTMLLIQLGQYLLLQFFPIQLPAQNISQNPQENILFVVFPSLLLLILNLVFTALVILNVKSITNSNYQHFFQPISGILKSFFPLILLSIISAIPLAFTLGLTGFYSIANQSPISLVSLPLIVLGLYFFIKLYLTIYVYLVEEPQKSIMETLTFTFKLSKGKMRPLALFCVLASLLPLFIINSLERLGDGIPTLVFSAIVSTFLSVFVIVFSFRFYQLYRQL